VNYWFKEKPTADVKLEFLDANGAKIRAFSSAKPKKPDTTGHAAADSAAAAARAALNIDSLTYTASDSIVQVRAGANRFVWDLQYPGPKVMDGTIVDDGTTEGPTAPPGEYQVRLIAGADTMVRKFTVVPDPRLATTQADYQAQFAMAQLVGKQITALTESVLRVQDIQAQVSDRKAKAGDLPAADEISKNATDLRKKFEGVRAELYEVYTKADQSTLNYPIKLYQMWLTMNAQVLEGDARPTDQHQAVFRDLSGKLAVQLEALSKLEANDLVAFNELLRKNGLPAVYVPPRKPAM